MELISVIVPVYKTEAYLDRCVQSIVDQTYTNLEIILVDDGSPDNCPQICDEWAKKDSRIRVIHKANGGGAQARNIGLEYASGEYIAFVDSDDYLFPSMYQVLLDILKKTKCDIAECDYHVVDSDTFPNHEQKREFHIYTPQAAIEAHISDRVFKQIIWNKLYKASTIGNVRFVEGKKIDDEFWTYRVLGNAERLVLIHDKLYCYRQHTNSVMHQGYSKENLVSIEAKTMRQIYLQRMYPEQADKGQINLFFTCVYHGQMALKYLKNNERKTALAYLKKISKEWKLSDDQEKMLKLTHRLWIILANTSFITACRIRNTLGIGL